MGVGYVSRIKHDLMTDIVVDNCAICRNHIMDLCTFTSQSDAEKGGLTNRY